jgi:hydroxypyruvate isomerase
MPRFCANLTMLYGEHDFLDRFAAAAKDGFRGVEYLFPYDYEAPALKERLEAGGLVQVLHNLPAGNWGAGERGIAVLPDRVGEFQDGVGKAIAYARTLDCVQLNCLVGIPPEGADLDRTRETLVANLRFAAAELKAAGIKLLIEPINTRDIKGFFLTGTAKAEALIAEVGSDNLFIQYDFYHMQIMQGDLWPTFERLRALIPHVQIADNPGRGEPGTGEIDYRFLFEALDRAGYEGWVGAEYKPQAGTSAGLGWFAPYKAAQTRSA